MGLVINRIEPNNGSTVYEDIEGGKKNHTYTPEMLTPTVRLVFPS